MAYANGTATLDFGATGGCIARVTVTGQATLAGGDKIEAWFQGTESTVDYNDYAHFTLIPSAVSLAVTNVIAGTSFEIVAVSRMTLRNTIQCSWVRST